MFAGSDAFFNLTGGGTAGELLFRMRVNSVVGMPTLSVGMEDSASGVGTSAITYSADGIWQNYSVKISDIVTDSVSSGTTLDLADIFNVFKLSATGGSLNLDIDDIAVKVACRDTNGCEISPSLTDASSPPVVRYTQDFESFDINGSSIGDSWIYFNAVFIPGLEPPLFTYNGTAPNGPQICALVGDQGGPDQGSLQMSVYSDYECCQGGTPTGHQAMDPDHIVEVNVFREETLTAADAGKTMTFTFNHKRGNIEGATTAIAFIKVLDPNNGFSETVIDTIDMEAAATVNWLPGEVEITLGDYEGQLLQYGFQTRSANFEGSGIFYDNVQVVEVSP